MDPVKLGIYEYRLGAVERKVNDDHEPRLRKLENMAAKVAVFAAMGSFVGGAVVVAFVNYFFR